MEVLSDTLYNLHQPHLYQQYDIVNYVGVLYHVTDPVTPFTVP